MSDLVSRLLAAVAAKERKAQKAIEAKNEWCTVSSMAAGAKWRAVDGLVIGEHEESLWDCEGSNTLCMAPEVAEHVADNDPAAVLRRCHVDKLTVLDYQRELTAPMYAPGRGAVVGTLRTAVERVAFTYGISVEEETTGE